MSKSVPVGSSDTGPSGRGPGVAAGAFQGPGILRRGMWGGIAAALCFVCSWLVIEPPLQHFTASPVFFTTSGFFREHLAYPGGLVNYAASFLLELYRVAWLGAFITTVLCGLLGILARSMLTVGDSRLAGLSGLGPGALLLMAQTRYGYAWMAPTLALVVAFAAAWVFHSSRGRPGWMRFAVFAGLAAIIHYAAASSCLVFSGLCALLGWLSRGEERSVETPANPGWRGALAMSIGCLATGALVPYGAANWLFIITLRDAYLLHLPLGETAAPAAMKALFLFLPALLLARVGQKALRHWRQRSPQSGPAGLASASSARPASRGVPSRQPSPAQGARPIPWVRRFSAWPLRAWFGHPLVWLGLGLLGLAASFEGQRKVLARIEAAAQQRQWPDLLEAAADLRMLDVTAVSDVGRALSHTGRLLEEMFRYPQRRGLELWLNPHPSVPASKYQKVAELLFELGHINRAERMAMESLELNGRRPATLKTVFLTCVLKSDPLSARSFLNLLGSTIWQRGPAQRYARELAQDPLLSQDSELSQVRPRIVTRDYLGALTDSALLQAALRQNPQNRMAADYLVAMDLLDRQLDNLVKKTSLYRPSVTARPPRHVQEALLLTQLVGPRIDLGQENLDPAIVERFRSFQLAYAPFQANPLAAEALLSRDFGDTYWYYYVYGHSGCLLPARMPRLPK